MGNSQNTETRSPLSPTAFCLALGGDHRQLYIFTKAAGTLRRAWSSLRGAILAPEGQTSVGSAAPHEWQVLNKHKNVCSTNSNRSYTKN